MDELEGAFDSFAQAAEAQLQRMAEEVRTLRADVATLRTETRSALTVTSEPAKGEPGSRGDPGANGIGIAGVTMRGADLVIRLTDGTEHNVGRVVGERGEDGKGERGDPGPRGADGVGTPGAPGERGADGIATREELAALMDQRFLELQTRTIADTYRGVYRSGDQYARGDTTTWDGSLFLCMASTTAKPSENGDWRLVVKRGQGAHK